MKRKITVSFVFTVVAMLAIVFSLIGCGTPASSSTVESVETSVSETTTKESEPAETTGTEQTEEKITLRYTSLRTEDVDAINRINAEFTKAYPNIEIKFEPIKNTEYDAALKTSLETKTGADIVMLRSFDGGRQIYDGGYLLELNDLIPNLSSDFTSNSLSAWTTEDGKTYGVPYFGSIDAVWYNKAIFEEYNLSEPETWDEFLSICQTLKDNGETVFAHGTKDTWVLTETLYCDLGPNFYGGEESRLSLINKEIKFTDQRFIYAFDKLAELIPYFPKGYEGIDYVTMQQMFLNEQAAMWIGGSWELGIINESGVDAGWFAPPVEKKGDTIHYAFYADLALGINKDTPYKDACVTYLQWVASPEHASLLANELPGMYPPLTIEYNINNELAQKIIDISRMDNVKVTGQLMWEKLSSQEPSGNSLLDEASQKFFNKKITSKEAVEYVQKGLDTWYFK